MRFRSVNPYNGEILNSYTEHQSEEVYQLIDRTHDAFLRWKDTSFEERKSMLLSSADELLTNKSYYAGKITLEMGKVIRESLAEIEKCAAVCRFYAENGAKFLEDESLETSFGNAYVHYNPLGVILAVMPWNFPFWQVFRFAAPALMAGNTCLLKHASNVPQCAAAIEEVFKNAGLPEHVFTTLMISSGNVAEVIDHPKVSGVTLTGSEYAGGQVASRAGKNIKKTVLELGGSDPFIVCCDADVKTAAQTGVKARMLNFGQSCIAAKRFILNRDIAETFTELFIQNLKDLKAGDPMSPDTDYAVLARKDLAEELHQQVQTSIQAGAKIVYGEVPQKVDSPYYPPLILSNISSGMPAYDEELFGPVALFHVVSSDEEAIQLANDSVFGLGASLWTNDPENAKKMASEIASGAVYVNQMMFSDPAVPFGGIKKSGYGRELSHLGIREFTNSKTIWHK